MADQSTQLEISVEIEKALAALRRFDGALDGSRKALREAASGVEKFERATKQALNGVGAVIRKAVGMFGSLKTAVLGLAAAYSGKEFVDFGANYEREISKLNALTKAGATEQLILRRAVREVGGSTAYTATQAAEAANVLASLGRNATQIAQELGVVVKVAGATSTEINVVAETVAAQSNVFEVSAKTVGNVFAAAYSTSAANVEKLSTALGYIGPVAKAAGLDLYETSGAISFLVDRGIEASTAGTALRGMLTRLVDPTKEVRDEFEELGISFKNFQQLRFEDQLRVIADRLRGVGTQAERNQSLVRIFGQEALSAATNLIEGYSKGNEVISEQAQKLRDATDAATLYQQITSDLRGAIDTLVSTVQDKLLTAFQTLEPLIKGVVEDLTNSVNSLTTEDIINAVQRLGNYLLDIGEQFYNAIRLAINAISEFVNSSKFTQLLEVSGRALSSLGFTTAAEDLTRQQAAYETALAEYKEAKGRLDAAKETLGANEFPFIAEYRAGVRQSEVDELQDVMVQEHRRLLALQSQANQEQGFFLEDQSDYFSRARSLLNRGISMMQERVTATEKLPVIKPGGGATATGGTGGDSGDSGDDGDAVIKTATALYEITQQQQGLYEQVLNSRLQGEQAVYQISQEQQNLFTQRLDAEMQAAQLAHDQATGYRELVAASQQQLLNIAAIEDAEKRASKIIEDRAQAEAAAKKAAEAAQAAADAAARDEQEKQQGIAGSLTSGVSSAGSNASRGMNIVQSKTPEEAILKLVLSNKTIADTIDKAFGQVFDAIDPIIDTMKPTLDALLNLSQFTVGVGRTITNIFSRFIKTIQPVTDAVNRLADFLVDIFGGEKLYKNIEDLGAAVDSIQNTIKDLTYSELAPTRAVEKLNQAAQEYARVRDQALNKNATDEDLQAFQEFAKTYLELSREVNKGSSQYASDYNRVIGDLETVKDQLENASKPQSTPIETFLEQLVKALEDFLKELPKRLIEGAKALAQAIVDAVKRLLEGTIDLLEYIAEEVKKKIEEGLEGTVNFLEDLAEAVVKAIEDGFKGAVDFLTLLVEEVIKVIQRGFEGGVNFLQTLVNEVVKVIQRGFEGGVNFLQTLINEVLAAIRRGFQGGINLIQTLVNEVAAAIRRGFQGGINLIQTLINEAVKAIQRGFSGGFDFGRILQAVTDKVMEEIGLGRRDGGKIKLFWNPFHQFGPGFGNQYLLEFGSGGLLNGPSHAAGGMPAVIGGRRPVELEGGEYIINRHTVRALGLNTLHRINAINNPRAAEAVSKYADGGLASLVQPKSLPSFTVFSSNAETGGTLRDIIGHHGYKLNVKIPEIFNTSWAKNNNKIFASGGFASLVNPQSIGNFEKVFEAGNDLVGRGKFGVRAKNMRSAELVSQYTPPSWVPEEVTKAIEHIGGQIVGIIGDITSSIGNAIGSVTSALGSVLGLGGSGSKKGNSWANQPGGLADQIRATLYPDDMGNLSQLVALARSTGSLSAFSAQMEQIFGSSGWPPEPGSVIDKVEDLVRKDKLQQATRVQLQDYVAEPTKQAIIDYATGNWQALRSSDFNRLELLPQLATGGMITGPSHRKGGVNANLEGGEFVIRRSAAEQFGYANLSQINQTGGLNLERVELLLSRIEARLAERKNVTIEADFGAGITRRFEVEEERNLRRGGRRATG